jgi:hypothetical protein
MHLATYSSYLQLGVCEDILRNILQGYLKLKKKYYPGPELYTNFGGTDLKRNYIWGYINEKGSMPLT